MLVLTRKPEQSVVVSWEDKEVRFIIIRSTRDKVTVGVDAPPEVRILREELRDRQPVSEP